MKNSTRPLSGAHQSHNDEFDLVSGCRSIRNHVMAVVLVTIISLVASSVYFWRLPNRYTAKASMSIERNEKVPKSSQGIVEPSGGVGDDYYGTLVSILTSQKTKKAVLSELGYPSSSRLTGKRLKLSAKRLRGSTIIVVSANCEDAEWAAKVANKAAEVLIRESSKEELHVASQVLKLIPDGEKAMIFETQGQTADFDKESYAESLSGVTLDPVLGALRAKKLEMEIRQQELNSRYQPMHPDIVELNSNLSYVDSKIKRRMSSILSNLRASLAGKINITNIRLLEEAVTPNRPSEPNRPKGIFIVTFLGFLVGTFSAVLLDSLNPKVWVEKDLYPDIPLAFLGYVPVVKSLTTVKDYVKRKNQDNSPPISDVLRNDPYLTNMIANIRTHIIFSVPYEKAKRIMLTSALPDEGKTTVAALLALSFESLGRNILLIDADMRRSQLHRILRVKNELGLSDYLKGKAVFEQVVRSIPGTGLKFISAGSKPVNPTELLASERFKELLDKAGERFDRVVTDMPPVLLIPDGLVVAKHVHTGVLVCGSGMIIKRTLKKVVEKFESIGHEFIGVVINQADYGDESYYYRYKYSSSLKRYEMEAVPA
jgi:capsular exopolysaccharide synthesis family protein